MFLTVYLSNNDKHFTEVPVTPETLCRDVVDLCKEPGESHCYLAEMWRGTGERERERVWSLGCLWVRVGVRVLEQVKRCLCFFIYSGENKYLNTCRFLKFGHLQRNV